jgi:hypothetical protein
MLKIQRQGQTSRCDRDHNAIDASTRMITGQTCSTNRPRSSLMIQQKDRERSHDCGQFAADANTQVTDDRKSLRSRGSSLIHRRDQTPSCDRGRIDDDIEPCCSQPTPSDGNCNSKFHRPNSVSRKARSSSISRLTVKHNTSKNTHTKRKSYNPQQAREALEAISSGMSVRKAASVYNIPRTTLQDMKKGSYEPESRPGPSSILTPTEEQLLCEWLIELSRRGIPISKECLLDSVQKIIQDDPRPNPFVHSRPGRSWFHSFLKRHSNIAQRNAESICRARGSLTEQRIRGWFDDAATFFREQGIEYVLANPQRQYNGDETGFQLDPKSGQVMAPRGEVVYTEAGGLKEQITVLVTTRADGHVLTNAIVFPYKRAVPKPILDGIPDGFCVGRSESGWMTSDIFFEYMANVFIPALADLRRKEKGLLSNDKLVMDDKDWVVYWIDGYRSHLTLHTSQICELNKVVLYCFKAHSSHICQPNDLGPFKPLKAEWKAAVSDWRVSRPYETLTRANFAPVLATAISKLSKESIVSGYRAAGLYPFNPDAVHYERLTATNRSKFDGKAFQDVSNGHNNPMTAQTKSQVALRHVEQLLGAEVVSLYNNVYALPVVDVIDLPPINAYLVWAQLKTAASGGNECGSKQANEIMGDNTVNVPVLTHLSQQF